MVWKIIFYNFGLKIIFGHFPFYVEYIIHIRMSQEKKSEFAYPKVLLVRPKKSMKILEKEDFLGQCIIVLNQTFFFLPMYSVCVRVYDRKAKKG